MHPVSNAPGVRNDPTLGVISSHIPSMGEKSSLKPHGTALLLAHLGRKAHNDSL